MTKSLEEGLRSLAEKYRALARLRQGREEAEAAGLEEFPPAEAAARAAEYKKIAALFPGCLRELESTPSSVLTLKATVVERELEEIRKHPGRKSPSRYWIAVVLEYHALLREALAAKKWLGEHVKKGGKITPQVARAYRSWRKDLPEGPHSEESDQSFLMHVQRPPAGRLQMLVWRRLEGRHGLTRRSLQQAVFGVPSDMEDDVRDPV